MRTQSSSAIHRAFLIASVLSGAACDRGRDAAVAAPTVSGPQQPKSTLGPGTSLPPLNDSAQPELKAAEVPQVSLSADASAQPMDGGPAACVAAVDCHVVDCSPFAFDVHAYCASGGFWFATGTCGHYHFLGTGGGYGGSTRYWDVQTGKLVAVAASTDYLFYCNHTSSEIVYGDADVVAACNSEVSAAGRSCVEVLGDDGGLDDAG